MERQFGTHLLKLIPANISGNTVERAIPTRGAYFGKGSGPIHLSEARCKDTDIRLIRCRIDRTGMNGCDHSEDAGVICIGKETHQYRVQYYHC